MTNRWLKLIDRRIGNMAIRLLVLFGRKSGQSIDQPVTTKPASRILLIKTIGIGDIVAILPAIKAIRERYPDAHITFMAMSRVREVLEGLPFLDEVIYLDFHGLSSGIRAIRSTTKRIKAGSYDLVIDFEHYYNFIALMAYAAGIPSRIGFKIPGQTRHKLFTDFVDYPMDVHETEAFMTLAEKAGARGETTLIPLSVTGNDRQVVESLIKPLIKPEKPLVLVHPGTSPSAISRRWPPEYFVQLIDGLERCGAQVVITGSEADRETVNEIAQKTRLIELIGKTTLKQFAALSEKADLVISIDTGPMHVAAASGTPVVGLFGPNTPKKWGPKNDRSIALIEELECSPCTRQYLGIVSTCKDARCMRELTPDRVLKACLGILGIGGQGSGVSGVASVIAQASPPNGPVTGDR